MPTDFLVYNSCWHKKRILIGDTPVFVNDMAASIDFYTNKLGLTLLRGPNRYYGNADMAFVGSSWDAYIELVYDLEDHPPYEIGNRYEHLALEVDDLPATIAQLRAAGVKIIRDVKNAPSGSRKIVFFEDPNGILVELLEPREHGAGRRLPMFTRFPGRLLIVHRPRTAGSPRVTSRDGPIAAGNRTPL